MVRLRSRAGAVPAMITLMLATPGVVRSQENRGATVPADLVAALLGVPVSQLTPGRVPDGLPFALTLPADARVLGGYRRGSNTTVALSLPLARSAALASVRETLLASGWEEPPQPARRARGFVAPRPAAGVLCRDGAVATVTPSRGASPDGTALRLNITVGADPPPCSLDRSPAERRTVIPMPTLAAPEGGNLRGGGGSQGEGYAETRALLDGAMPVEAVASHFHAQLEAQDWAIVSRLANAEIAVRTYSLESADGRRWQGVLVVIARPGQPLRDLTFRVADVTRDS